MNKTQLVEAVALETGLSKVAVKKSVDSLVDIVIRTLRENERVTISGFGSFSVIQRSVRMGRNPRSGAPVRIAPQKVVRFRSTVEVE